jgi:modification methylase
MTSASRRPTRIDDERDGAAELPLAVWPCAQQTSQWQRHGRYLPESNRHPGKMLPELARRAIRAYSEPGDLVLDPLCGIGTTLVESAHLGRDALGVELERQWAALASANVAHARAHGAPGRAGVIEGDARDLTRLLTVAGRRFIRSRLRRPDIYAPGRGLDTLLYGHVALILTSPPYGCEVGRPNKAAWRTGANLCLEETRNYSRDRSNLGRARGERYTEAMREIYDAAAALLKPGGFLVAVTRDRRAGGALHDLASETIALCQAAGLLYWQHVIALLAAISDGKLVPHPSFWQVTQLRKALRRGERVHRIVHEDVLVFHKPRGRANAGGPDHVRQGRLAA